MTYRPTYCKSPDLTGSSCEGCTDRCTYKPLTTFMCGPNRTCQHDMSGWEDIVESDGRVSGGTSKCVICGETAYNLSMWGG